MTSIKFVHVMSAPVSICARTVEEMFEVYTVGGGIGCVVDVVEWTLTTFSEEGEVGS